MRNVNVLFDLGLFPNVGAQFDFKRADLWVSDGYSASPLVNLTGGYSIGATSMVIDGLTGFLEVNQQFTVPGDDTIHTITAVTNNSTTTTGIQFTPALAASVSDDAVLTVGPHRALVVLGEGTFSYTVRTPRIYTRNRGRLSEVRDDEEQPLELSLQSNWEFITGVSGNPTISDILNKLGAASHWISSDPDNCRPYSVDFVLDYEPYCENVPGEEITFPHFRVEEMGPNANDGIIDITGRCNVVRPTAVRSE